LTYWFFSWRFVSGHKKANPMCHWVYKKRSFDHLRKKRHSARK
jgi:hypothetical protein